MRHGVWIEYESGRRREFRGDFTILEAIYLRKKVYALYKQLRGGGAVLLGRQVGVSGGPKNWK